MSDERKEFNEDPRVICKYGEMCYQKNEEHHNKYKHPPPSKTVKKHNTHRFLPYNKLSKVSRRKSDKEHEKQNQPSSETTTSTYEKDKEEPSLSKKEPVPDIESHERDKDEPSLSKEEPDPDIESHEKDKDKPSLSKDELEKESEEQEHDFSYYHKDTDPRVLKELFLVEMPEDFFKFFECLKADSKNFVSMLDSVNLELIGPFDFLLGKLPKMICKDSYLNHWRFFYDPPEFQSVLKKKGTSKFHIGYFRDDPNEKPVFLAKNDSAKDCIITPIAENIFAAVYWFLQNDTKSSPFVKVARQKLMAKVKTWAEQHKYSLEEYDMKKRLKQIVCKSFHGAGIVVPYDKKTQLGYRPLIEKDGKMKELFKKLKDASSQTEKDNVLAEIQPIINYASIAVDECDFGTGLEIGIALFCSGLMELQCSALKCLGVAYSVLGREAYKKIITEHLLNRRKGVNLGVL